MEFFDRVVNKKLHGSGGSSGSASGGDNAELIGLIDGTGTTFTVSEELSAHYGFVWSKDPKKALPFISLSTSPYMKDDCCTEDGAIYRSILDNNVWAPSSYPRGWKKASL